MAELFERLKARPRATAGAIAAILFLLGWTSAPATPDLPPRRGPEWRDPAPAAAEEASAALPGLTIFKPGEGEKLSREEALAQRRAERAAAREEREAREARQWRYAGQFHVEGEGWLFLALVGGDGTPAFFALGEVLPDGSIVDAIDARGVWITMNDEGGERRRFGKPEA